jgi:hypothetical protein
VAFVVCNSGDKTYYLRRLYQESEGVSRDLPRQKEELGYNKAASEKEWKGNNEGGKL